MKAFIFEIFEEKTATDICTDKLPLFPTNIRKQQAKAKVFCSPV